MVGRLTSSYHSTLFSRSPRYHTLEGVGTRSLSDGDIENGIELHAVQGDPLRGEGVPGVFFDPALGDLADLWTLALGLVGLGVADGGEGVIVGRV